MMGYMLRKGRKKESDWRMRLMAGVTWEMIVDEGVKGRLTIMMTELKVNC